MGFAVRKLEDRTAPAASAEDAGATRAADAIARAYTQHGAKLALLAAFLIPLKLSFTYIALLPLLLGWLIAHRVTLSSALVRHGSEPLVPLLFFVVSAALHAPFGINPSGSLLKLGSLLFVVLTIPAFRDLITTKLYPQALLALIAGQTLAAAHSVLESTFPAIVPMLFLGEVTESGQLALVIPAALGLALQLHDRRLPPGRLFGSGLVTLVLCTGSGFYGKLPAAQPFVPAMLALASASWIAAHVWHARRSASSCSVFLWTVAIPLLVSALLLNLKRGPWAGVLVASILFALLYARRLLPVALVVTIGALVSLAPVRERVLQSYEHFTISGGRSAIWAVGGEIASRFPLGIGFHNSRILRKFSAEIPPELTHFHNNLINIVVETGWLSAMIFAWWIFAVMHLAFGRLRRSQYTPLAFGLGAAIVSWQIAGLVEYNFGDSEVLLVALILIGALSALQQRALPSQPH